MGYTHYWELHGEFDDAQWEHLSAAFVFFAREVFGQKYGDVCTVRPDRLWAEIHETFVFRQYGPYHRFCKTAFKVGDALVVAMLLLASEVNPDNFCWSSDGCAEEHEEGRQLCDRWKQTRQRQVKSARSTVVSSS